MNVEDKLQASSFDLERFVKAQNSVFDEVLEELRDGYKRTHWMWYIFPQLVNFCRTPISHYYGISGIEEARAYLEHQVLGPRLIEVSQVILDLDIDNPAMIFGTVDAKKLCSCMTLFHLAAPDEKIFSQVIDKFYAGLWDNKTIEIVEAAPSL